MSKIQIESGQMSSATHRLTQTSQTLNRRYVRRPANIAIEEAARSASKPAASKGSSPATPSRLVNLRVSAAELAAAKAEEAERAAAIALAAKPIETFNNTEKAFTTQDTSSHSLAPTITTSYVPQVVEFGRDDNTNLYSEGTINSDSNAQHEITSETINEPEAAVTESATSALVPMPPQEVDTAALAMNIAADYAAASLGASIKEYGNGYNNYALPETTTSNPEKPEQYAQDYNTTSVDSIAQAAADAIASIRSATDPSEISAQITSLQAFAKSIKESPNSPEMHELSDTIEKFISIAMKSTGLKAETEKAEKTKFTLSPKINRAATKVTKSSAKVIATQNRANVAKKTVKTANNIKRKPKTNTSPQELKERAIEQALHSVEHLDQTTKNKSVRRAPAMHSRRKGGVKRFLIAFSCATACVAGVIAFVGSNMPDVSVRVAAMQTGISATYPSYVPRDYTLDNINSEDGKITMTFTGPEKSTFTLIEEKSSWDSSALLRNYVEPRWNEEYTATHEQGITIYINNTNSDAIWVNSGILYKITSSGTALTKKQVRNIVVSL